MSPSPRTPQMDRIAIWLHQQSTFLCQYPLETIWIPWNIISPRKSTKEGARMLFASTSEVYEILLSIHKLRILGKCRSIGPRSIYDEANVMVKPFVWPSLTGNRCANYTDFQYLQAACVTMMVGDLIFIKQALQKPLTIWWWDETRSFCYVDDLAGVNALMESSLKTPCNIGNHTNDHVGFMVYQPIYQQPTGIIQNPFKRWPNSKKTEHFQQRCLNWEPKLSLWWHLAKQSTIFRLLTTRTDLVAFFSLF